MEIWEIPQKITTTSAEVLEALKKQFDMLTESQMRGFIHSHVCLLNMESAARRQLA